MKTAMIVRSVLRSAADIMATRASVAAAGACVVASLQPGTHGPTATDASIVPTACTISEPHSTWDAADATTVAVATTTRGREHIDTTQLAAARYHWRSTVCSSSVARTLIRFIMIYGVLAALLILVTIKCQHFM